MLKDFYLLNQILDVSLWAWVFLIMIRRVCNFRPTIMYIGDIFFFIASIIAVVQLSNQYYYYSVNMPTKIFTRETIWMLFHKLVTVALIITFFKSQPQFIINIIDEIKQLWRKIMPQKELKTPEI